MTKIVDRLVAFLNFLLKSLSIHLTLTNLLLMEGDMA